MGVVGVIALAGVSWVGATFEREATLPLNASLGAESVALVAGEGAALNTSYDLSAHQTLSRVILLIRENYVDPQRVSPYDMFLAALDNIEKSIPEVIVDDTVAPKRLTVSVGATRQVFELGDLDQLWEVTMALRDIFRFLQSHVSDANLRRDIEYAAINGMLSTLDPHSVLLKPESFDEVKLSTKGEFGGLGVVISVRDGSLTVISPIAGTPAARAGLKAKDRIVKIGEESTVNMSLEEAVHRLRGKPQTKVNVWVMRKNWSEARRFSLTRAVIKIESVTSELLAGGVGYVRIKSFQNNTYDDLRAHLERMRRMQGGQLKGVVLDLRNNPGGLLDQAILVSDRFVDRGPLVITVGEGNRKREVKPAHFTGTETDYPVVVLVNGGSASASEIVSGALKNHDRAVLIGQQTFGKGSVQVLYDFKDKSALKLTIAQYLTPGDVSIQSVGIAPDIEIMPVTIAKEGIHLFVDDDGLREKDLKKHLAQHAGPHADQEKTGMADPIMRVMNLVPDDPEADEEEDASEGFKSDFEIELARQILAQVKGVGRSEVLQQAMPILTQRAKAQQALLAARLQALGADWRTGPAGGAARVEATLAIHPQGKSLHAGDTVEMVATVHNISDVPLYRAHGISVSENPLLKNREFVFGLIAPGETRSWTVPVKLPREMAARADEVEVTFGDQHGMLNGVSAATLAVIQALPKPRFVYTYALDDRVGGNGDGLLQPNEQVDIDVEVSNRGDGPAEEPLVTLKNLTDAGVFLDVGRVKLEAMAVGAQQRATLRFSLKKAPEDDHVALRLGIWDGDSGVSEALDIPIVPTNRVRADKRILRVLDGEIPVFSGAAAAAPRVGFVQGGAWLRSDATVAGMWHRVALPEGRMGFVRGDDVQTGRARDAKRAGKVALRQVPAHAAPQVDIVMGALVTEEEVIHLRGEVRDEGALKDVFVFVNDKKTTYRSLEDAQRTAAGLRAPVDFPVTLREGSNAIMVVARENDDLVTRRVFGVYRKPLAPVAERTASWPSPGRSP